MRSGIVFIREKASYDGPRHRHSLRLWVVQSFGQTYCVCKNCIMLLKIAKRAEHRTRMHMGETGAGSRKPRKQRSVPAKHADEASRHYFPSRIPGMRIAYVSGRAEGVKDIEVYWQSRGAIFMHCPVGGEAEATGLNPILNLADIVFHSAGDTSPEMHKHLLAFCERAEKPLITLNESSLSGLTEALVV